MNTAHSTTSGPIPNTQKIQPRRRSWAHPEAVSALAKLRAWMDQQHGYIPAAWACHHLRLSRNAVRLAVWRGWVREEKFRCADGTVVSLVSSQDVARIRPRRHRLARIGPALPEVIQAQDGAADLRPGFVRTRVRTGAAGKPSRAKGKAGGTRGRPRTLRMAVKRSRR